MKIKTKFENPQQLLFDIQQSTNVRNISLVGGLDAYNSQNVVGIKISEEKDKVIIENFGKSHVILKQDITAELEISNKGFVEFCDEYKNFRQNSPTWIDIVPYIITFTEDADDAIVLDKDLLSKIIKEESHESN